MSIFLKRVRHEIKKRELVVKSIKDLNRNMRSIVLTSDDLGDFNSLSPDDHIKLFFETENGLEMRDYTPRSFDNAARELVIDFALHDNGIATEWAKNTNIGDTLNIGGPRGSLVIEGNPEWWVLIGDETAIPSITRRLEEFSADTNVIVIIAVAHEDEKIEFATKANLNLKWIIRPETEKTNADEFIKILDETELPDGEGFIWVAAEALVTRKIREYLLKIRNHPPKHLSAKGYWVKGLGGATEKFDE